MSNVGFIMLRHVNSPETNKLWNHCYSCIRKYYPENLILIIDDNSNKQYVKNYTKLYKTLIIPGEYPGRGELLPYCYYLSNKLFYTAVIIHDSVFINSHINTNVDQCKFIWNFEHVADDMPRETQIIKIFNDENLTYFYNNKHLWKGCFGCMTIIKHDYLSYIDKKYNIKKLLPFVLTRLDRCAFERVLACLLQTDGEKKTILGNIHKYCPWGIRFADKDNYKHLPLIKVWTGR